MITTFDLEQVIDDGLRLPIVEALDWKRPLPEMDDLAEFYFHAAAEGALVIQVCPTCGHRQHYPRHLCLECGGDPAWIQVSGEGSVYTFAVVRVSRLDAFKEDVPYAVAMIELAEGPRLMANVTGCHVDDIYVGMPVEGYVVRVDDRIGIPFWRPRAGDLNSGTASM